MEDGSDDDLMRRYCDGDAEAFETLFDRHYAGVYRFARMLLGDHGGPEDVLQESFLAVARTARRYVPRGRFRAWLMRIVRNRCLNRLASRRLATGGLDASAAASDEPAPPRRLEADERTAAARAALANLPDRQREAVALYAFEQMTYAEIAEAMELPINTVKTLIHRGRAALARRLAATLGPARRLNRDRKARRDPPDPRKGRRP